MAGRAVSAPATEIAYFALLASPQDAATRLSQALGSTLERVEGDDTGWVLYRGHTPDGAVMLELQNVGERLEGTVYSLVALARDSADGAQLEGVLQGLAREAGATRQWTYEQYRATQGERSQEPG
jgi:hypothetical protein